MRWVRRDRRSRELTATRRLNVTGAANLARVRGAAAWVLLLVALLLALAAVTASTRQPFVPQAAGAEPAAHAPAQFAEAAIEAWLTANADDADLLGSRFGNRIRPDDQTKAPRVLAARAYDVQAAEAGSWAVIVAVRLATALPPRDGKEATEQVEWRYFRTTVTSSGDDAREAWVASIPSEVAGPATADPPELVYSSNLRQSQPVVETVASFLTVYLTGEGDLDRYVAPTSAAIRGMPAGRYQDLTITQLRGSGPAADMSDGATVDVLADIEIQTAAGRTMTMQFALQLIARDGRWELSALRPSPLTPRETATLGQLDEHHQGGRK